MDENDRILIADLTGSFRRQLGWYRELRETGQKILGQLVLSRGDLSCLAEGFRRKQELLDRISAERSATSEKVAAWQSRKALVASAAEVHALDSVLAEAERAIREFLDSEEQLKRYIEGIMQKSAAVPRP